MLILPKSRTFFVNLVARLLDAAQEERSPDGSTHLIAGSATLMQARSLTSYNPRYRWLRN